MSFSVSVCTNCSGLASSALRRSSGPLTLRAIRQLARRVEDVAREAIHLAVLADGVEVLEREAERIHHAMTRVATRVLAVLLAQLAESRLRLARHLLGKVADVRRRRTRRRAADALENPRSTQHRRRAVRVRREHQHPALPSRPRRAEIGTVTGWN